MSTESSFGRRVARLRRDAGLSQGALAEKAGLSRNYIGLLETGGRSPSLETALRIRDALGANWMELLPDAPQGASIAEPKRPPYGREKESSLPESADYVRLLRRLRRCSAEEIALIERIVRSTLKLRALPGRSGSGK